MLFLIFQVLEIEDDEVQGTFLKETQKESQYVWPKVEDNSWLTTATEAEEYMINYCGLKEINFETEIAF